MAGVQASWVRTATGDGHPAAISWPTRLARGSSAVTWAKGVADASPGGVGSQKLEAAMAWACARAAVARGGAGASGPREAGEGGGGQSPASTTAGQAVARSPVKVEGEVRKALAQVMS